MILKFLLILFIFYLPAYLILLFFLKRRYAGYTVHEHMVSYLATSDEPWRSIFNISTIVYGALSLVLPASLHRMLGSTLLSSLGATFLLGAGAATILVGFFPMDRKIKIHNVAGSLAFLSALLTGVVFAVIFYRGLIFSPLMVLLNSAVIVLALLLVVSLRFRCQNSSLLEWSLMVCTIAWNFMLSTVLLAGML